MSWTLLESACWETWEPWGPTTGPWTLHWILALFCLLSQSIFTVSPSGSLPTVWPTFSSCLAFRVVPWPRPTSFPPFSHPPSFPLSLYTQGHTSTHECTTHTQYTYAHVHMYTHVDTCIHTHTHTHTSVFSAHYQLVKMVCLLNYLFVSIVALSFCLLVLLFFKILLFQISVKSPQGNSCMLQSHWLGTHTYTQRESQNLCKTPITRAQGQDLCCQPEQYHSVSTLHRAMQGTRTILWGGFDQLPRVSKAVIVVLHYQLSP